MYAVLIFPEQQSSTGKKHIAASLVYLRQSSTGKSPLVSSTSDNHRLEKHRLPISFASDNRRLEKTWAPNLVCFRQPSTGKAWAPNLVYLRQSSTGKIWLQIPAVSDNRRLGENKNLSILSTSENHQLEKSGSRSRLLQTIVGWKSPLVSSASDNRQLEKPRLPVSSA